MQKDFKYHINGNSLIIESCPNQTLTNKLLTSIPGIFNCDSLYINEGIKQISSGLLLDTNIKQIKLPETLQTIEPNSFYGSGLKSIIIPSLIKKIPHSCFSGCWELEEISLPDSIENIEENAFASCIGLQTINIPPKVKELPNGCFYRCTSLEDICLHKDIKSLGDDCFGFCKSLKRIKLPDSIENIGNDCFMECNSLKQVDLSKSLSSISRGAFSFCSSLETINIPDSVKKIGAGAFKYCQDLKNIQLSDNLKRIYAGAFQYCSNLETFISNNNLDIIANNVFENCKSLKEVTLSDSIKVIGNSAFKGCENLVKIVLSKNLKEISCDLFYDCNSLTHIDIPDDVEKISLNAFYNCRSLEYVHLPEKLKVIESQAFSNNHSLKSIYIPQNTLEINDYIFEECRNLKLIRMPMEIKYISNDFIGYDSSLEYLNLYSKNREFKINMENREIIYNDSGKLFIYNRDNEEYIFINNGKFLKFKTNEFQPSILYMLKNKLLLERNLPKVYYWNKKKIIPGNIVMQNMPIDDIDKFYINGNGTAWMSLVKEYNIVDTGHKEALFKLCYVLGMFSDNSHISDVAVEFIKEKILDELNLSEVQNCFQHFDLHNGFNQLYAEFFIKYYDKDFLTFINNKGEKINLIAASYNNFDSVMCYYPNKKIKTNRKSELLTPNDVLFAIMSKRYDNIKDGNQEFAYIVGKYGYTQQQFERLQQWYETGKALKETLIYLKEDDTSANIKYNLLSKKDTKCAVLGNITNCCQVINGIGSDCLEYGMTQPNSSFITFNYKDSIIGQSWVWYDVNKKILCLDNIEMPDKYFKIVKSDNDFENEFINCLIRMSNSFKIEMAKHNLAVNEVSIGQCNAGLNSILEKYFPKIENPKKLDNYVGYSDAKKQFKIINMKNMTKRKVR